MTSIEHLKWIGDAATGYLRLLDQTRLPMEEIYLECRDVESVWQAVKRLSVRGAPAIGIAAAYGCVLSVPRADSASSQAAQQLQHAADYLATSRPTAVNLFWALDRMKNVQPPTPQNLLEQARAIHDEDRRMCQRIGQHGLELVRQVIAQAPCAAGILTHCNAGALATGGIGTATAPMYLAQARGLPFAVWADETRPLLQGARLTAYELSRAGIDVTLICDDMAAPLMHQGRIQMVITGADRIAANGDTANKIGTYNLAVLARHHEIPFYVAAPGTTFDFKIADGDAIPIEHRPGEEITETFGKRTAPQGIKTYSPAFDVTPHQLVTALITDRGVIEPVNARTIHDVLASG